MQGRGEIRILDSTNDSTVRAIAALLRCLTRATYCMQQGGDGGEPTAYPTTSGVSCLPLRRLLPTPPASPALRRLLPSGVSCPLASLALRRLLPSAVPSYPTYYRPHRLPAAPLRRACDRCFSASPDGRLLCNLKRRFKFKTRFSFKFAMAVCGRPFFFATASTNSASNRPGRPAAPLQNEAKRHLNANIMAWYCMGVDTGVK